MAQLKSGRSPGANWLPSVGSPSVRRWPEEDVEPASRPAAAPFHFLLDLVRTRFRGRVLALALAAALAQLFVALEPYALKSLVDTLAGPAAQRVDHAWLAFALLCATWLLGAGFDRSHQAIAAFTIPSIRAVVNKRLFGWVIAQGPTFHAAHPPGSLDQRMRQAGNASAWLIDAFCYDAVRIATLLIVSFALLAMQSLMLGGILLSASALYLSVSVALARRCTPQSERVNDRTAVCAGATVDVLSRSELVRAFFSSARERQFIGPYVDDERAETRRLRLLLTGVRIFQDATVVLSLTMLGWLALRQTLSGAITVGAFVLVLTSALQVAIALRNVSQQILTYYNGVGAISDALRVLSVPLENVDKPDARPLVVTRGRIEFRNVSFGFPGCNQLFRDLSLVVEGEQRVGIVGVSGAGKTSLVRLLRREYSPQAGQILIDGQDIADVTLESLSGAIAEVAQHAPLLRRSIADNIRYGRPGADEDEVREAALLAQAGEFILAKPGGFESAVDSEGAHFSGGERQRLAIARAVLKDSPILVLDEASSGLDPENERLVESAIASGCRARTVIVIAHKLSLLSAVDRIFYIRGGRVVEEGSHGSLLAREGHYAEAWHRQKSGYFDEPAAPGFDLPNRAG